MFHPSPVIKSTIVIIAPIGPEINITIAFSGQQSNTHPSASPVCKSPSCSYSEATKQSNPKKTSFKFFNKKSQAQETEEHPYSLITTAKSADRPRPTGHYPPLCPTISNPISTSQSQTRIHQTQAQQQQQHQIYTQNSLPYSGFINNRTLQPPTLIPAPPQALQTEPINYSNTPQFSTQLLNFANTDKTNSSKLPQPIHTVSTGHDILQDIRLISDTSISDPHSSQLSSPTPSKIASNPFNTPQGPVTNFEHLLSQAHWNHSFNIFISSSSFQSSLPLSFQGTPSIITLISNSPTPDPDQHSHQCTGQQPDTNRTYPTLPLKLGPNFFSPPALFGDHNNGEQLHNWAKQRTSNSYKITPVQKQQAHEICKQSKITFSVEIVVEQDKLIVHPRAAAPPIFRVKTNPSPFICQEILYNFDRYTKNTTGYFAFYNPHSGLSYTCSLQI